MGFVSNIGSILNLFRLVNSHVTVQRSSITEHFKEQDTFFLSPSTCICWAWLGDKGFAPRVLRDLSGSCIKATNSSPLRSTAGQKAPRARLKQIWRSGCGEEISAALLPLPPPPHDQLPLPHRFGQRHLHAISAMILRCRSRG